MELLLSAAAGDRTNHGLLLKDLVPAELASAMEQAGFLRTWAEDDRCWDPTPAAHRLVSRVVSEAQVLLGHYCSP